MAALRVTLFIAGVQKAGTTTLHAHLAAHPQLQAGRRKELHFFDNERVDWSLPDYARLHDAFAPADREVIRFEATPIYTFWPPALARLKAYNPDARLIVIFRDPALRALSHWRMEYARKAETLDFSAAIREGRKRLEGLDRLARAWRVYSYVERGFYTGQLERLYAHFPPEQCLLLEFDAMIADMRRTLDTIAAFAGIDPFTAIQKLAENAAPPVDYPQIDIAADLAYLRDVFAEDVAAFAKLSGLTVNHWQP